MKTLFVDQLTVIDFSYLNHERGLLGESWLVDCELTGELNDEGMLFDFGHVKKTIKQFIDDFADHKLLIAKQTPNLGITESTESTELHWHNNGKLLKTKAPNDAYLVIDTDKIEVGIVSDHLESEIKKLLPSNVSNIKLHLYPEILTDSFYHYSHGLKKHDGNCQRIAHGHRSPIQIFKNQIRDQALEKKWANLFNDIYIGTREDIEFTDTEIDGILCTKFSYQAPQGYFELTMNQDQVYIMDTDTTVEWIADHIALSLKHLHPESDFKVKAFEGYRKGSIAQY